MFYRPEDGHGLPHNPISAVVAPRPIAWISTRGSMGDNLTVSPRGGLLMCEDGGKEKTHDPYGVGQRLMGRTASGDSYIFAKNHVNLSAGQLIAAGKQASAAGDHRTAELAGACFDPAGQTLFVYIYTPGITVAITGPFAKGPL